MYMWFVDLYIGNSHRCCYLPPDVVIYDLPPYPTVYMHRKRE